MSVPNRQIGWSVEANLMNQISLQLDRLLKLRTGVVPTTTTTSTTLPIGWYLRPGFIEAANNGDITLPNGYTSDGVLNPNLVGVDPYVSLLMNIYDINGNTVPDLMQLIGNNGFLTLTQGANSVTYSFIISTFVDGFIHGWNNQVAFDISSGGSGPIVVTSPSAGDFNLIDSICISFTIV